MNRPIINCNCHAVNDSTGEVLRCTPKPMRTLTTVFTISSN